MLSTGIFSSLVLPRLAKTQLEKGIAVEAEHDSLYKVLEKWASAKNLKLPFTIEEFRKKIAEGHIKEIADYYDLLLKHVEKNKDSN